MANLFKKIYVGALAKYTALGTKDNDALYMTTDEATGVKAMFKGTKKVSGDFIIVNGAAPATPEKGVIYYISEYGKTETQAGAPYVGFYDGTAWKPLSDSATIAGLESRIGAVEDAIKIDGTAGDGTVGKAVNILTGDTAVTGSVAEQVDTAKKAIEGTLDEGDAKTLAAINDELDTIQGDESTTGSFKNADKALKESLKYEDTVSTTSADVVVAVSEANGVVAPTKKTLSIVKSTDDLADGVAAKYTLKVGDVAVSNSIEIPETARVLHSAKIGDSADTFDAATGTITPATTPSGAEVLHLVFALANGTFEKVDVDVEDFLTEAEFKNGLTVNNHEVSVKLDTDSFLEFKGDTEGEKSVATKLGTYPVIGTGTWDTPEVELVDGLATVSATTKVIVENEKVTAAALNDLNSRIGAEYNDEGKMAELKTTAKDSLVNAINELVDTSTHTTVTAATADQEVTVATDATTKVVTIGVTKATYTVGENKGDDTLSDTGLVDGKMVKDYVEDHAIYWEELA